MVCSECGNTLTISRVNSSNDDVEVRVDPCTSCMSDSEQTGKQEGYDEGWEEGYNGGLLSVNGG